MEKVLDNTTEFLTELQPSYELLAVLDSTARVREHLSTGAYGQYFVAFTDGSCAQHETTCPAGRGGWGAILFNANGESWEMHGIIKTTTSNRAEVCALLAALASVPEGVHLGVHSDSRYLVDHVRNNCRSNDNADLWREVCEMLVAKDIKLSVSWLPGHSGHRHNERCDRLASIRN